jgi:2-haloacid dehalogenase
MTASAAAAGVQVLAFDIFGTVVDWHGSIVSRDGTRAPCRWMAPLLPLAWRAGYKPAMAAGDVSGELGVDELIDDLHRHASSTTSCRRTSASHTWAKRPARRHLNRVWHRLNGPGPTASKASRGSSANFTITTLSNGNIVAAHQRWPNTPACPGIAVLSAEALPRTTSPTRPGLPGRGAACLTCNRTQVMLVACPPR